VGTLAAPAVLAQAPLVMKMQTSWPASDVWQEMAQDYATRVEEMSGGRLKVDLLPAGAVVGAFQVMDAVNDGVIDASHSVASYWYGKSKAASFFGTGPVFGGSATTMIGWFYQGGGQELYRELTQDILGMNTVGWFGFPMPASPSAGSRAEGEHSRRHPGLQVPHCGPRSRPHAVDGACR
jgi:TRAP-type mannitol/chloroaromatic compound transport system substrate-binding protein